jgi:hypothetical protein
LQQLTCLSSLDLEDLLCITTPKSNHASTIPSWAASYLHAFCFCCLSQPQSPLILTPSFRVFISWEKRRESWALLVFRSVAQAPAPSASETAIKNALLRHPSVSSQAMPSTEKIHALVRAASTPPHQRHQPPTSVLQAAARRASEMAIKTARIRRCTATSRETVYMGWTAAHPTPAVPHRQRLPTALRLRQISTSQALTSVTTATSTASAASVRHTSRAQTQASRRRRTTATTQTTRRASARMVPPREEVQDHRELAFLFRPIQQATLLPGLPVLPAFWSPAQPQLQESKVPA